MGQEDTKINDLQHQFGVTCMHMEEGVANSPQITLAEIRLLQSLSLFYFSLPSLQGKKKRQFSAL